MRTTFTTKLFILGLGIILFLYSAPRLSADEESSSTDTSETMDMVAGDIQTITFNNLTRVSVTNPDVADISDAQNDKVTVLGKKSGNTILFLWSGDNKRTIHIRVTDEDLSAVKGRVEKILKEANITGVTLDENLDLGKLAMTGDLTKEDKRRLEDVVAPYSDNLMNFVKEKKVEDLVQVDMQIVEINVNLEKNLGIQWGTSATVAAGSGSSSQSSGSASGQINLNYNETLPKMDGKPADWFKIGKFSRTTPLVATVNALLQEGKARLISKPRLVVVSGKQASFLVGGEIPITSQTTNTTGSTLTSNTTYTQYGVNLSVTPTVRDGKVEVLLNVDIRDVDASTPISSSGGNVAFVTRNASTDLLMDNKQTIALAGLIKYEDSVNVSQVPFLGKVPILGALFRNKSQPANSNTEMVIILTPTVLTDKKYAESQIAMPTPEEKSAWKEIASKYPHEPMPSQWTPSTVPGASNDPSAPASAEVTAYARSVQQKISMSISYPQSLSGNSVSGTVKLRLRILKDGSLDSEEVVQSSGNDSLDQDAMQAAKIAAPYNAFTYGISQDDLIFTVPIVYNRLVAPAEKVIASY